ncbi:1-deoxy-D-xylulose-5-phosphate synthase [Enemella evansiae]|uniref:1-deoxy-D-xylulose-5-phosphate synthase n=1 Tax=Enemella evansiae TaxID=2016499 RepID=A0A255G3J4_9ACTN|nr:1-deoxy-D-xylulose-5-phosphate synthase [Enemella evansiae]OYO02320.1 1-deoxy-D-xylulose-5-phosphate synthase [Enemella evansiae]OYO05481.1 1-deoxy-D-xylulose-5-phosphate synthase [Enemella evansiae]OYO10480.1 1-deoxy-D-xylulose-5-phosphate synthase [Enemella evansiae]PFG67034.1 1-deoxy-D-xylulose-5-phosphate synthase [Propionibacteriaceae bacterium ES.041]
MPLLDRIKDPRDLRDLSRAELDQLAGEIRAFLVSNVSRTGGHLGPNLGVVELTIALHRVFDSPHDPFVFDTGHQSYVHKILTGRQDDFPTLRQLGGLSGYPCRAESEHDWVESSHASSSLSWAEGMAKGFRLQESSRRVIAVIGDGALTGGMAWEAVNNIAVQRDLPLIMIANDNGRSYTPTVGGLASHLTALRTDKRYEQGLDFLKRSISGTPLVGRAAYEWLHGVKIGLKDVLAPQGLFADLGMKYVGPIDGHDLGALERALQQAKGFGGPVIVHVITEKGRGFKAAEENEEDRFHSIGQIDEITGEPLSSSSKESWTDVFSTELVDIGRERPDVVAVTAAMLYPTGLHRFAAAFPDRTFDVGIAEQHALTSAAGLSATGLHPVVGLYSTFLNRAFDQLLMDVALHKESVTLVLDRAGITGTDGPSHNGMWDSSILSMVPGLWLTAPRDGTRLREALRRAVEIEGAPSVIRYSKDKMPADIEAVRHLDGVDVLSESERPEVLVVAHGQFAGMGMEVGERLSQQGIGVTVVDPLWALPVNPALIELARAHQLVITLEDSGLVGGLGSRLSQELRANDVWVPLREFAIRQEFLDPGSRSEVLEDLGLTSQQVARYAVEFVARATDQSVAGTSERSEH